MPGRGLDTATCEKFPGKLLLDQGGNLSVIDMELLDINAFAYDLARTTYLWPMERQMRKRYLEVYTRTCAADEFLNHFSFWIIFVLSGSAVFRAQTNQKSLEVPIKALKEIRHIGNNDDLLRMYGYV